MLSKCIFCVLTAEIISFACFISTSEQPLRAVLSEFVQVKAVFKFLLLGGG